jgi:hypothetical protein
MGESPDGKRRRAGAGAGENIEVEIGKIKRVMWARRKLVLSATAG